jgi:hypothetical protein
VDRGAHRTIGRPARPGYPGTGGPWITRAFIRPAGPPTLGP